MNKMKNINYITLACLIIFCSCKKDYLCNCTIKETSNGVTSNDKVTYTFKAVSKTKAKSNCISYSAKNESTGDMLDYNCTLK